MRSSSTGVIGGTAERGVSRPVSAIVVARIAQYQTVSNSPKNQAFSPIDGNCRTSPYSSLFLASINAGLVIGVQMQYADNPHNPMAQELNGRRRPRLAAPPNPSVRAVTKFFWRGILV
jgi:hypothetical protein